MAGINAALQVKGQPSLILDRQEAYTAILIDDLISKGRTSLTECLPRARVPAASAHRQCRSPTYATRPPVGLISNAAWDDFQSKQARLEKVEEPARTDKTDAKNTGQTYILSFRGA